MIRISATASTTCSRSGTGSQRFTASKTGYATANAQVNVVANSVTALGFALHAR